MRKKVDRVPAAGWTGSLGIVGSVETTGAADVVATGGLEGDAWEGDGWALSASWAIFALTAA